LKRTLTLAGVVMPDPHEMVAALGFDVPDGCTRIAVAYEYDAGQILDLGLMDPEAGAFPSERGFRGWSGGARSEAFVTESDATPGYLPGPLLPGRWQVLLGRAKVEPQGCRYRVTIDLDVDDPGASSDRWYAGDLQSHTHHSDARGSVADLLHAAAERGLDFLAVTDHNTIAHHADLNRYALTPPARVLPIAGMEVTTYRGHANVWGARGWVDFRIGSEADLPALIERVHALGGLFSINHPKPQPGCIGCDWTYPTIPDGVDALEAWQGPWWLGNWASLARYDALLASGRRITLVGGSDRHQPAPPDRDPEALRVGSPTTFVNARARGVAALLRAIAAGRAFVAESPRGPRLEVHGVAGDAMVPMGGSLPGEGPKVLRAHVLGARGERLRWVGAAGVLREVSLGTDDAVDLFTTENPGAFVRAEVIADASLPERLRELSAFAAKRPLPYGLTPDAVAAQAWRLALANPIYLASGATHG
jgi:hypothetical protein